MREESLPWILFDQDGTLNAWRWIDVRVVRKSGYFRSCVPHQSVIDAAGILCEAGEALVGTCGAAWDDGHSRSDKDWWMDRHCPCIGAGRRFYVPCGTDKASCFEKLIGRPLRRTDLLVDDNSEVLRGWEARGGTGVKVRTPENGRHGTWKGPVFDCALPAVEIADYLLGISRSLNHEKEREVLKNERNHD